MAAAHRMSEKADGSRGASARGHRAQGAPASLAAPCRLGVFRTPPGFCQVVLEVAREQGLTIRRKRRTQSDGAERRSASCLAGQVGVSPNRGGRALGEPSSQFPVQFFHRQGCLAEVASFVRPLAW